ncbi:MAG: SelB C-terminal domain-containing protein [Calditrichia bacterium]
MILKGVSLPQKNEIFRLHRGQDVLYYSRRQAEKVLESFRQILHKFHEKNPGRSGLPVSELQSQTGQFIPEDLIRLAVKLGLDKRELRKEGDLLADAKFKTKLTDKKLKLLEQLEAIYREAQLSPPVEKELLDRFPINEKDLRELLRILREQGRIVLAEEKLFFHSDAIAEAEQIIREFFEKNGGMEVPEFKELTGTTRKYAIPLLNYFDNLGITSREENMRVPGPRLRNE